MWGIEPISLRIQSEISSRLETMRKAFLRSKARQDGQNLDDFSRYIEQLCDFIEKRSVSNPDIYLHKVYEPLIFPALADYRTFYRLNWNAFFRLENQHSTMKLVAVRNDNDTPLQGLKSILDSL